MVRKKVREIFIEIELVFVYVKINRLVDLEEFILGLNYVNIIQVKEYIMVFRYFKICFCVCVLYVCQMKGNF